MNKAGKKFEKSKMLKRRRFGLIVFFDFFELLANLLLIHRIFYETLDVDQCSSPSL